MTETQHIEDALLSPQCLSGQHEVCKRSISWIGEDGVSRSQRCPCRCHDRAPVAGSSERPERLYILSWEYEVSQEQEIPCPSCKTGLPACPRCSGKGLVPGEVHAWIKRRVLAVSKGVAEDWIDAVAELAKLGQVRNLIVLRAEVGKWEKVEG